MDIMGMSSWIYFLLLIELVVVSYLDITTQKIKNYWSIVNIVIFVFLLIFNNEYVFHINTFLYAMGFLLVGFVLYLMKIMGAGDTKFMFSFFLVAPLSVHDDVMRRLIIFTGLSAFIFLIFNMVKNIKKIIAALKSQNFFMLKDCFGSKFAFAPVVFLTWLWLGIDGGYFVFK